MQNVSKWHMYSHGRVAENSEFGNPIVKILPLELYPFYNGMLEEKRDIEEHQGVDAAGKPYVVKVKRKNTIDATWWNYAGTHRATAPNVRRAERVVVFRFADEDNYRWISLGEDDGLRRLEDVLWLFSDTLDEKVEKLTEDNSYAVRMSTKNNVIYIKTVKENGEPFAYEISVETKSGSVNIKDDDGQEFHLVSAKKQLIMQNKDRSKVEIIGPVMNLEAPNEINLKTKTWNIETTTTNIKTTTVNEKTSKYNATIGSYVFTGGSITHNGIKIDMTHMHATAGMGPPSPPMP